MSKFYAIVNTKTNSVGRGQCRCSGDDIVCIEVMQEVYDNIEKYIYVNNKLILNPNYDKELEEKEAQRIAHLTMTALDFITFLRKSGLTLEQINAYLENNLEVKIQLTYCQNVYCGVACELMPISLGNVTITREMVIKAFIDKERSLD